MRLLILDVDTLRNDHLGCSGYPRRTSPNIDALAAEGVRLANVFASDLPCLPSRTAFCTGRFGIKNGVVNHGGLAAELRPEGAGRGFMSRPALRAFAAQFYWQGWHTATLSAFPLRHSAPWWTMGFQEALNPMRGVGLELASDVEPHALDWLERNGRRDQWLLHVHVWDPHTPYRTPAAYGNPFAGDAPPAWITEEVRAAHWQRPGPHSAQETIGWHPAEHAPLPRQPAQAASLEQVKAIFDGYDTGIRFADDMLGRLVAKLDELGVRDETAIWVTSDHGEQFGELGVYCDHMAADEATAHIPGVLRWPGLGPAVDDGLHYHVDVAATVLELAGLRVPRAWDGIGFADALRAGAPSGRDMLVLSQGAWTCQRSVRTREHLYLRTWHDGFHDWPEEMLFRIADDPHEQHDLAASHGVLRRELADALAEWTTAQLDATGLPDPMQTVLDEGGPWHCRGHLRRYLQRLRETGRGDAAARVAARHPVQLAAEGSRETAR